RQEMQMIVARQYFESRHNGTLNTRIPTLFHKSKVSRIIKKHLRNDIVSTSLYLLFKLLNIEIKVGRFKMLLRIAGHAHTKVGLLSITDLFQIFPAVHILNLIHQIQGILIKGAVLDARHRTIGRIPANGQYVINAQVIKLNKRILGLFFGKTLTNQMRYGIYAIFVHNSRTEPDGAGTFALDMSADGTVAQLLIVRF